MTYTPGTLLGDEVSIVFLVVINAVTKMDKWRATIWGISLINTVDLNLYYNDQYIQVDADEVIL